MKSVKKILIIGKGSDIVKTFYYVFKNNQVSNISFRKAWKNPRQIKKFDIILVSGFHHYICQLSDVKLLDYIKKYINFLNFLKKKCNKIYLISTDLSVKKSVSRVVFFYYLLNKKIFLRKNIRIISFHTIIGLKKNILQKIKIKIFKILNIKNLYYKDMKKIISKKQRYNNYFIKFYFIKFPRARSVDRILRLFLDLYIFKIIKS